METAAQAQLLGPALEEYDLWSEVGVSSSLDIHVAPHQNTSLARLLDTAGGQHNFVCLESIGRSYEGQEMVIAKVCKGGCGHKPAMWIDGGIHAREWISPAAVMWLLKELVENHVYHPDLLDNLDW